MEQLVERASFNTGNCFFFRNEAFLRHINGHFERYTFIIPGAQITGYDTEQPVDFADVSPLLAKHRYVLVQRRVGQPPCSDCRVIDERWDLRSRQNEPGGALAAFKSPETFWYAKEYLVERLAP